MNCDCIKELKQRLKDELPKKSPKYANMKIIEVGFDNESFVFGETKTYLALAIPVTITHEPIGRKKTTKLNLTASYCPICGKRCNETPEHDAEQ